MDKLDAELVKDIGRFYDDPLNFVRYIFPWGHGALKDQEGPDDWQIDQLSEVRDILQADPRAVIQDATGSGHGIGKSAETAWLILWAMSTRPHLAGVVTANTQPQLKTKTWRELAVWHKRALNSHWFQWTATSFFQVDHPETWAVHAIPNSEHNSEAFAGLHAEDVLIVYDEASAIPDPIWEVTEGAMTTPGAMWFVFGNPTRNTGRFRQCWGSQSHRWRTRQIDSRNAKMTNKEKLQEWVDDYGEDSDFVRVRVRGLFPKAASGQFIGSDVVSEAIKRTAEGYEHMPKLVGVDVARFGDDKSVICIRQGRKLWPLKKHSGLSTVELAREVARVIDAENPDGTFVDGVGVGGGVVDQLKDWGYNIHEVNAGSKPLDGRKYFNKRAEMYGELREWVKTADLPDDDDLRTDMENIEYHFSSKNQIALERKEDAKKRGIDSPDCADAVSLTFAELVVVAQQEWYTPPPNEFAWA